ncbi:uncharacterized protein zgc:163014 isoform X1 [Brienomyrus brachyistius]|uniref:uncharacterized protein zgc:163014 isoform X1 n=1 Tax=Brienomyrus brachyistius TaxID=42636 RepID=UPI0020B21424|nr:uncharacterized protein zgc:163014 isoform X1 [Brienomyrus brachyistius]
MGKVQFFALWSLSEAPRQFISKCNRLHYQIQVPLPLPMQLVVFGLGDWAIYSSGTTISVEVLVSQDLKPQLIGTLSSQTRCLVWEGDWRLDLLTEALRRSEQGIYGKIVLTVSGEVTPKIICSTPLSSQKRLSLAEWDACQQQVKAPDGTASQESTVQNICYADLKSSKAEMEDSGQKAKKSHVWPTDKTPRRTVIGRRGQLVLEAEELGSFRDSERVSSPQRRRLSSPPEGHAVPVKVKKCRAVRPSTRWCHAMCMSDPETAVVIGGEAMDQARCPDTLWKLEIDSNFWFPMDSPGSGHIPCCSRGLSATFDPESKAVYVYGGLKRDGRHGDVHVLDTLTWKWKLIAARGDIPALAYHSAVIYKKELFVFGGIRPSGCPDGRACSNALYIFNPEFELWYQPIVEGDRPLPRFGHSMTLLSDKMIIFGGRKTSAYLNDLHVLDLGFMEYIGVKYEDVPPLPRGFHAAISLGHNRILISGGCCAMGALQDLHVFSLETGSWSAVSCPALCSQPRAGHSMLSLGAPDSADEGDGSCYTVLVFGGSDCAGTFYNNTIKCAVEIPEVKLGPRSKRWY